MTVPVHIITGFLGAGKTTLLNRLLRDVPAGLRPAIIVNDFGKVVLDGELIDRGNYTVSELASGCVCCTLSGALSDTLIKIVDEQAPDVILIETTGVAQPKQFPPIFAELAEHVHMANVICVVDSISFARYEMHLKMLRAQVEQCNTVILNKISDTEPDALAAVCQSIEFLRQPDARVIKTNHCEMDITVIYDERPVYFEDNHHIHTDEHGFHAYTVEDDAVYAFEALQTFFEGLVGRVERAKGIVQTDIGTKCFQLTLSGCYIEEWQGVGNKSKLIFIGRELEGLNIPDKLSACTMVS
jgi:G3E family GTPase